VVWYAVVCCGVVRCDAMKGKRDEQTGCGMLRMWGVHSVVGEMR